MINFREIFNPNYNFIGLLFVALLMMIILLLNRNIFYCLKVIGKTFLISGMITLFLDFILYLGLNMVLISYYKIIIQVISNQVLKNCLYYSIISIMIGIVLIVFSKIMKKRA
ncbi:MAG: hypothetical protein SO108_02915 [Bacilli bacterium]|nr:hypothetical protein [Bacilli bacterium]